MTSHPYVVEAFLRQCFLCNEVAVERCITVKSRFNEWPRSAHFHSLNRDFTLNRDFLMRNSILVTRFRSLN